MAEPDIVDIFAGPGGWDLGLRMLGHEALGVELDPSACKTREAAGLPTLRGDVSRLDPREVAGGKVRGVIASPPCGPFSSAGKQAGRRDKQILWEVLRALDQGDDQRARRRHECEADDSLLVVEPLRWVDALEPEWVALEQVPPVLEFWKALAPMLKRRGYSVWTGILSAERFGVPQTRRRAILMAHRGDAAIPPEPTHQEYVPDEPAQEEAGLFGNLLPWVSMAEALGWGEGRVGFPRLADDGAATEDGYRERDFRDTDEPAFNLTEKARSWDVEFRSGGGKRKNAAKRDPGKPAPTIAFGNDAATAGWVEKGSESRGEDAIRVEIAEAAVLQSFPSDYPWQGTRSAQFRQVGDAVPPLMARAILEELV